MVNKYRRILVPVDGSEYSLKAVQTAVFMARAFGSEIDLIYVTYFESYTDSKLNSSLAWLPVTVTESVEKVSSEILRIAQEQIPSGIPVKTHVKVGNPKERIAGFAADNNIDLIIIASRGLGLVESVLVGSVSQHLLERASCPVMVLH